jgi:hypothetical protein
MTSGAPTLGSVIFEIGGEDQLQNLRSEFPNPTADAETAKRFGTAWREFLNDVKIRVGTLLKTDTASVLLGAGASRDAGGPTLAKVPKGVESAVLAETDSDTVAAFYAAARQADPKAAVPLSSDEINARAAELDKQPELAVDLEALLAVAWRWRTALLPTASVVRVDGGNEFSKDALDRVLATATSALAKRCILPRPGDEAAVDTYRTFVRKLLTRPLNLKRINVFTLNYDTLMEQACDSEGVVAIDGFVGLLRRVFRPEAFDQDLYFPAQTTEGRVHRLDRVLHLYKVHGSISWRATDPDWHNPYGIAYADAASSTPPLIYPTPAKHGQTLGTPYSDLLRRFAATVVRPQSTLIAIGYSFRDDHINAILRQALAIPSFTLCIVTPRPSDPDANGDFVAQLRAQRDRRLWTFAGEGFGRFAEFVDLVLPDLNDEDILRRVYATHSALSGGSSSR